jgi:hypothetical protein
MIPAIKMGKLFSSRGKAERFLRTWWWGLLLAFAFIYYGQYYRAGLYPAAEGGLEGVVALRLMEGQRPIIDTFLGYNLLWFYPVVWIFKLVGPSYTALRLFFLTLCTVTGLVAFRIVLKSTGRAWASFLAAILVLVIPGQMFRNYMAFVAVVNMALFLSAYVLPSRGICRRLSWMAACGVMLGVTYLIRIDVGVFLSFVLLGLIFLFTLFPWSDASLRKRILIALAGLALALLGMFATHLPVYLDAERRGFSREFMNQYLQWPDMIRVQGVKMIGIASQIVSARHQGDELTSGRKQKTDYSVQPAVGGVHSTAAPVASKISREALERRSVFSGDTRGRMLALNIYLPVLVLLMLAVGWFACLVRALFYRDEEAGRRALVVLTCLGSSLVLFPQYFFWRPDMVHLSEFMVPMTVTMIVSAVLCFDSWKSAGRFFRAYAGLSVFLLGVTLVLYYINACQSQSSGGIATMQKKRVEFHAANGVRVKLTPEEFKDASAIQEIITAVSGPGEYVICYPYNPEVNFMTDRPSYEHNLYSDNAIPADRFNSEAVAKIEKYRPVGFVITDWEVNNTKESRFSNWASATYGYIASNYVRAYRNGIVEVFVRADRAARIPPR